MAKFLERMVEILDYTDQLILMASPERLEVRCYKNIELYGRTYIWEF